MRALELCELLVVDASVLLGAVHHALPLVWRRGAAQLAARDAPTLCVARTDVQAGDADAQTRKRRQQKRRSLVRRQRLAARGAGVHPRLRKDGDVAVPRGLRAGRESSPARRRGPTCRVSRRQHALGDAHVADRVAVELRLHRQAARRSRSDERRLSAAHTSAVAQAAARPAAARLLVGGEVREHDGFAHACISACTARGEALDLARASLLQAPPGAVQGQGSVRRCAQPRHGSAGLGAAGGGRRSSLLMVRFAADSPPRPARRCARSRTAPRQRVTPRQRSRGARSRSRAADRAVAPELERSRRFSARRSLASPRGAVCARVASPHG